MKIVRKKNYYVSNNLLVQTKKQSPFVTIGSKKAIKEKQSHSKGRTRGISLSKQQKFQQALFQSKNMNKNINIIHKHTYQSPQIRLKQAVSAQNLMKQPLNVMVSLNTYQNNNFRFIKTVHQTSRHRQIQYISQKRVPTIQNNKFILPTKNYQTFNPQNQYIRQSPNKLQQKPRQNKFIFRSQEHNPIEPVSHSLSQSKRFQLSTSTSKQNKFKYGFQFKQKPVLIKVQRQPRKIIQNTVVYNDYLNQRNEKIDTKNSKDTCECNPNSNKNSIKIPLQNSVKSTNSNQQNKLTYTVRGSTKSIWDAYKTQSIVSEKYEQDFSQRSIIQPMTLTQKFRNYIIQEQTDVKKYKHDQINLSNYFKATDSYYQME